MLGELSREALAAEYASSDAFVLPSRGEGWCLPCAEAMSSGLPLITTNHSGPKSFMSEETAMPVRVDHHHPNGQAEPSRAHLRQRMRAVASDPEHAKQIGLRARAERRPCDRRRRDITLLRRRRVHTRPRRH